MIIHHSLVTYLDLNHSFRFVSWNVLKYFKNPNFKSRKCTQTFGYPFLIELFSRSILSRTMNVAGNSTLLPLKLEGRRRGDSHE